MIIRIATAALLSASLSWASAQTVYRCGPDGRQYSQTPCADGQTISVNDERSAEQRADAERLAQADATRGRQLERERHINEAAAHPAAAGSFNSPKPKSASAPAASATSPHKKKKHSKGTQSTDDFKAVAPASRHPKSSKKN